MPTVKCERQITPLKSRTTFVKILLLHLENLKKSFLRGNLLPFLQKWIVLWFNETSKTITADSDCESFFKQNHVNAGSLKG